MKTFADTSRDLLSLFKRTKSVAGGVGKITPYVAALAVGTAAGGAPLTLAGLIILAAGALDGVSSILEVLVDPKKLPRKLQIPERFDYCFHLLCQEAYAAALTDVLPKLTKKVREATIESKEIGDPAIGNPEDARTYWSFDPDLKNIKIPFFSACSRRLNFFLSAAGASDKVCEKTIRAVDVQARKMIEHLMTRDKQPYTWIFNYVQFKNLTKVRETTDSLPETIAHAVTEAALGFVDSKKTAGAKDAWTNYRSHLQELPSRDIFGSEFGIRNLYVLPSFTYDKKDSRAYETAEGMSGKEEPAVRDNLVAFMTQLISNRTPRDNLIFLFGDPGVGKTSFAQILSDALSRDNRFHPVYIPLQHIDPTKDLVGEIEQFLNGSPLRDAVPDLHNCSNVVFILEAFDELAQATRERMGDFFRRLERFSSDQLYRGGAVVATGRHTLFTRGDAMIPPGTHVVTLLPFSKIQVSEWTEKWNRLSGQSFDVTRFWPEEEKPQGGLHDLVTQPLLLYLLAKLEESGKRIEPQNGSASRSGVYRDIIQWVCAREEVKASITSANFMSSAQMRKLLRLTGFATMTHGRRSVHLEDLSQLLEAAGLSTETVQDGSNYKAERTFLLFAFTKTGQAAWEFKHKQFGEYLAAEYLAERMGTAIARSEDPDEPGNLLWTLSNESLVRLWGELFAQNGVTQEVLFFLPPMIANWNAFVRDEQFAPEHRSQNLKLLMSRIGLVFSRLVAERDAEALVKLSTEALIPTTMALANCLSSAMKIGSQCADLLSSDERQVYFNLEEYNPGGWWKALSIIRCYHELGQSEARAILGKVCLDKFDGTSLPSRYCPGIFLPFAKILNVQPPREGSQKVRRAARGASFPGALLYSADLSGVKARGAKFIDADLSDADLRGADLAGADLQDADLRRANLFECNLKGSSLRGANFDKANLEEAQLDGAYRRDTILDDKPRSAQTKRKGQRGQIFA